MKEKREGGREEEVGALVNVDVVAAFMEACSNRGRDYLAG